MSKQKRTDISEDAAAEQDYQVQWTLLTIDELTDAYWNVIAPKMRDDDLDPESDRPTHEWLSRKGFRGLIYTLRQYHDRTFGDFWANDLDLNTTEDHYNWGINHDETIELLETYLDSRSERGDLTESTTDTLRYRIGRYVDAYADANDTGDLITPVAREEDIPAHEATDAAWRAFDTLDAELSARTMRRIHEAVDDWYAHLVRRKRARINPVSGLEDEYRWSQRVETAGDDPENPPLEPNHVQQLYAAAETPSERLAVIGLCAWGLRSSEVAALHQSQLVLEPEDDGVPYLEFESRKNGPGHVSILYGVDAVTDRLAALSDREPWNGYLFPSERSDSGHRTRQTILNWFDELVERAELPDAINGRKPVPQMGRRFWYDAYSATQEAILEEIGEIAAEQGSASAEVVLQEYLSPSRRRRLRREYMRERLEAAFDPPV